MTQETTHREPSGLRARLQATRNDERGIALQTVIIMVVLLAIAGGIAAVLLARGQEASDQLASSDFGIAASEFTSARLCRSAGHGWEGTGSGPCRDIAYVNANNTPASQANCHKFNDRWVYESSTKSCKPPAS